MSKKVLDSSAILAAFNGEVGSEKVDFSNSIVSSINVAEVFSKIAEASSLTKQFLEDFDALGLEVVSFDIDQARKTAELRPLTRHLGLSLGDRCCLALAILSKGVAVTADKEWKKVKMCQVEVIR